MYHISLESARSSFTGATIMSYCARKFHHGNRVFHKKEQIDRDANNGITGCTMWKKNPVTKCYSQWVWNPWTSDSKSNTLFTELIWYMLLRRSLNFCSCTSWFLDLDDLVRINRAWLYKEPDVSVLKEDVKLVQKGECWTWNQRSGTSVSRGVTFSYWIFFCTVVKPLISILTLLPITCFKQKFKWRKVHGLFKLFAGDPKWGRRTLYTFVWEPLSLIACDHSTV